jgi:hypothetical protein
MNREALDVFVWPLGRALLMTSSVGPVVRGSSAGRHDFAVVVAAACQLEVLRDASCKLITARASGHVGLLLELLRVESWEREQDVHVPQGPCVL